MDKSKTVEGIILSRKNIGEADRILSVFSKNEGKIKIVARGARKIKSKNASHIEPFTVGKYSIVQGKTFYILTGADSITTNNNLAEDLNKYKSAAYLCELLDIAGTEGQKMPLTYQRFLEHIAAINEGTDKKVDKVISEYVFLSEMGYSTDYFHCKDCNHLLTENDYYFGDFEGISCPSCIGNNKRISKDLVKMLRLLEKGEFDKIKRIDMSDAFYNELKEIITDYLAEILPRAPKTELL